MNFGIGAAKAAFFDREKIIAAVGRAKVRNFSKGGALVRRTAQKSLRYGKGTSPPGQPPTAHRTGTVKRKSRSTGKTRTRSVSFLREFLFFAWDAQAESVVVGPAKLNSTVSDSAPASLEHGGRSVVVDRGKRKTVTIRPHPFMRPAAASQADALAALWKDSVR